MAWRGVAWRGVAWRGVAWRGVALAAVLTGCAPVAEPAGPLPVASPSAAADREFDLGPILAHGQEVPHEFRLVNTGAEPLQRLRGVALTPCCSTVGTLPDEVAPGATYVVPVVLKPGRQTGRRRAEFLIGAGPSARVVDRLALVADLLGEFEVGEVASDSSHLDMSERRLIVIGRRQGTEGRPAPESITGIGLEAAFEGPAEERTLANGLIESSRAVRVTIPTGGEPGTKLGAVRFSWSDGRSEEHRVLWRVEPSVRVAPAGLVVRAGAVTKLSVSLRADRPFRVTGASGPLLVGYDDPAGDGPSPSHQLRLDLDSSLGGPGASDVRITTDHPDQAVVVVSVVTLPSHSEADE